jgi:diguanylate cyclase (GGDEF)-like protein/PAS domain S-box-containing protein
MSLSDNIEPFMQGENQDATADFCQHKAPIWVAFNGICQNVTELRQVVEQTHLLQAITHAIATSPDFDTALTLVLSLVCQATDWVYADAWIPNAEGTQLEASPAWYCSHPKLEEFRNASLNVCLVPGQGLAGRVWHEKQPIWMQDVSAAPETHFVRRQIALEAGLRAGLNIPILANDEVVAVLGFFMFEPREEDKRLVALVSAVTAQLGAVIQLKRTEVALWESQQRLTTLINALPGIVFSCTNDREWSMKYLSEGCFHLTGYRSEELVGKSRCLTYNDITHPEDLPAVLAAIEQAIPLKQPYVVEYRIQTKAGEERWFWEKGSAVYDDDNNVLSLEGFITDITERKQVEEAVRRQLAAIEAATDGIAVFNQNQEFIYLNEAHVQCFGYSSFIELMGRSWRKLYPPQEAERIEKEVFPILQQTGHWRGEAIAQRRDGSTFPQEVSLSLIEKVGLICVCRDITERKQAEAALRQAEEKYRGIFENAVEGIFQTTPDGHYLTANPMLARIYGYDSVEELMVSLTDIEHQLYVDCNRRTEFRRLMQQQDAVWSFESQIYRKDGSIIWISENARAIRDASGQVVLYEGTVEDITIRKQAEAELHKRDSLLQGVAEATNHLLTDTDYDAAITKALATLGMAAGVDRVYIYENHPHFETGEVAMSMRYEWVRQSIQPSIHQPHWQNQPYNTFGMSRWYDLLSTGNSVCGITREFPLAEQEILGRDQIRSILMVPIQVDEVFWGYVGIDDCQTERVWSKSEESILITMAVSIGGALKRRQAEAIIRYQAFHDLLTGLPNRMLFNDRLPISLAQAHRNGSLLAVMFLDLDRFKTINDTLGHAIGDLLLQNVAARLSSCLREGDTVSRWGGDEFTILLPQISCAEDAAKAAQRILDALKPAFNLDGHELYVTSSIGVALYPYDGDDCQTLLKNADAALYRVKEQGRNGYQIYTPAINSKASELLALESSLHHALERGEFVLYYQPQVNITTWEITRMEALIRWQHPELGEISPRVFIPLAEENGLIVSIGEWVLQTACTQNRTWHEMLTSAADDLNIELSPLRVAVNLSARQFQQSHLVECVTQTLADTRLDPYFLELEITETTAMQNVDFTSTMLHELREMGVHLSMDDFGTGYSSLNYLKKFPLHTLKIDRSFTRELTSNSTDAAIVAAVIALGKALGLSVVAEGVETIEQLEFLRSLHCEEMQGYLFSQPMNAEAATYFLQKHRLTTRTTHSGRDEISTIRDELLLSSSLIPHPSSFLPHPSSLP